MTELSPLKTATVWAAPKPGYYYIALPGKNILVKECQEKELKQ